MSLLDDRSRPISDASSSPSQPGLTAPANDALHPRRSTAPAVPRWTLWLILGAGLIGGVAGFEIGEVAPQLVPVNYELSPEIRSNRSQVPIEIERRKSVSRDKSAAIAYGGLGMVLGLALGVAGGVARRSTRAAIVAGVVGLVLGAAAGGVATKLVLPSYHAARAERTDENFNEDLGLALRTHGAIWLAVGAAAGLAYGLGLGGAANAVRATVGGILGAALATAIYEFSGAIVLPLAETFRPMSPSMWARLLAHLVVALSIAVAAYWAAQHLRLRRTTPASAP
jgi:hypothetical protein